MNTAFIAILDTELARVFGDGRPDTISAMATEVGLDKATLSRIRNGKLAINRNHASRIAKRLRKDPDERSELERLLLNAQPALSEDQKRTLEWFRDRARPDVLMIVEFREPPMLRPGGGRTLTDVAQAVTKGLCYAMISPFPRPPAKGLRAPLQVYIEDVYRGVEETYQAIMREVLNEVYFDEEENAARGKERPDADVKERLIEAVGRLKFYYLSKDEENSCPGIGHRMFYVEDHGDVTGVVRRQSWEWRTVGGVDQMALKDPAPEQELRVAADRFQPIIRHWNESQQSRLPASAKEMYRPPSRFDSLIAEDRADTGIAWSVYGERTTTEQIVVEFLKLQK